MDNLQHVHNLRTEISRLEKLNKKLVKRINHLESDSLKSLCNVTSTNKRLFKIALRRKYSKFSSTTEFVKFCIKQYTGISFKEFCEMGE